MFKQRSTPSLLWMLAGVLAGGISASPLPAAAQSNGSVSGVYTCIDGQGRHLRSDRPIPECADREQRLLSNSGMERGRRGPALSDVQRQQQAQEVQAAQQQAISQREQRRRDALLLQRFPNEQAHAIERQKHMRQFDLLEKLAQARLQTLQEQYQQAHDHMQPYQAEPARAPAALRSALEEAHSNLQAQQHNLQSQVLNRQRAVQRLDEELERLRQLWLQTAHQP